LGAKSLLRPLFIGVSGTLSVAQTLN